MSWTLFIQVVVLIVLVTLSLGFLKSLDHGKTWK